MESDQKLQFSAKTSEESKKTFNPIVFHLKHVPKELSTADILDKLSVFGDVCIAFESPFLLRQKNVESTKFKMVGFSFCTREAQASFKNVKRLRIKGYQLKTGEEPVQMADEPKATKATEVTTKTGSPQEAEYIDHSIKPGMALYSHRRVCHDSKNVRIRGSQFDSAY